ncbi:GH3 domain-containing protein [Cephalotus follicularis]|uniref:GH3 domain-containing protein n=1 Tax=Cephalotus follicularis TaxID=3775 RepID=A0A1Q3DH37_CEPFO|nr:GH3 domain-containing protein [Cephalotus follicularis]
MEPAGSSNGNGNYASDIVGWFEQVSENASLVQTETLGRILELNYGVEYLKKYLGDTKTQEMDACALESLYTSLVPLASHADLEPYIHRIAEGDTSPILTQQPITELSLRVYPIREGGRILEFIYSSKQFKTKGGITVGTATTHYYASEEFKIKQEKTKSFTCSPKEVISGGDYIQSTYCHFLLGLFYSDQVEFITSTFAYSLVQAFRNFEELWRDICNDIKEGTLSSIVTPIKMRKAVLDIISPNPNLAWKMENSCRDLEKQEWYGLVPKLWPNAKYVYSIMTGSMEPYLKKLRHYGGDLPLVSADYGSTESWIGVNVDPSLPPESVTFAVMPTFSYFEFIPLYREKQECFAMPINDDFIEGQPVPLSQVIIGQQYEIVLTTFTGLYRCRLGDVVEVSGFHKGTPKLNFICRRKLILTVNIDKNTEKDLQLVVDKGSQLLSKTRAELIDFTSHADVTNQPGHYIIYWEIKGDVEENVLGECCSQMDASFVDHGYVVSRRTNSIGPLELCIVEMGTFKKILDYFIGNGAALSQFKTPRCTRNQVLLTILNVSTIKRVFSTAYR